MKIAANLLRRWTALPTDDRELRRLLDDLGLEVKRAEPHPTLGTVFTLELLANRGDHHCYAGLAREITGPPLDQVEHTAHEDPVTWPTTVSDSNLPVSTPVRG